MNLEIKSNQQVKSHFKSYPENIRPRMLALKNLILESAEEVEEINKLEECLKWGEPSYLSKYGSTIRIDWKAKAPQHYAIYFKCTSKLVPCFKRLYPNTFNFEGNRAIVFDLNETIAVKELKNCIKAALMYHKVKHLPELGIH